MKIVDVNFINSRVADSCETILAKVVSRPDEVDVLNERLVYQSPATNGFILRHAAGHIDADYISFNLFDYCMIDVERSKDSGWLPSGDGTLHVMKIQNEDLVIGGVAKRDILLSASILYDFMFLDQAYSSMSVVHIDNVDVDPMIAKQFIEEAEAIEIRNMIGSSRRYAIFTFTNDLNALREPTIKVNDADYVCFSNSLDHDVAGWTVVRTNLSKSFIMSHPHLIFSGKHLVIWTQPGCIVKAHPADIDALLGKDDYLLVADDAEATCVYSVTKNKYFKLQNFLVLEGFPADAGFASDFVIAVKPDDDRAMKALETLYEAMLMTGQSDARLLLNYAIWKAKGKYLSIPMALMNLRFFS